MSESLTAVLLPQEGTVQCTQINDIQGMDFEEFNLDFVISLDTKDEHHSQSREGLHQVQHKKLVIITDQCLIFQKCGGF